MVYDKGDRNNRVHCKIISRFQRRERRLFSSGYKMKRFFYWVFVVSTLLQFPFSGAVLCVGSDGHFSFENSQEKVCCASTNSQRSVSLVSQEEEEEDNCGACIDIPLLQNETIVLGSAKCEPPSLNLPSLRFDSFVRVSPVYQKSQLTQVAPFHYQSLLSSQIRSTILLI
ncbi:MAG: hypothetical protein P9L94_12340 [Candidatus Hinthialibacter antarcticus]|nr:hypothetical protein [Candidatus Hinthialibacter antarcticus]